MKLLIQIRYLGTAYCGYQVQPNAVSIQQKLNEATRALFGFDCDIVGCSRTDSGVHADCFCATVARKGTGAIETEIPLRRLPQALSAHLPQDISVFGAAWVPDAFHARYDVLEKEYLYRFYQSAVRNPFLEGRALQIPKPFSEEAFQRMNRAAETWLGSHDFRAYMAQGSKVLSTVRNVTVSRIEPGEEGSFLFRVAADGFLYNMVRIMAGTLLEVGQGRLTPEDVQRITECGDRSAAGATLPPYGLYLHRVTYPPQAPEETQT